MRPKNLGNTESIHQKLGPMGRVLMCACCLVCALGLGWLFISVRKEMQPSKNLEHPDTLRFHFAHQATTPVDHERQDKIIADYSRMRCWYPVLVQSSLIGSFLGSACAIVGAFRLAFPGIDSLPQAPQAIAKDRDKPEAEV